MTGMLRDKRINLKLSQSEKDEWEKYASEHGLKVAELIRRCVNRIVRGVDGSEIDITRVQTDSVEIEQMKSDMRILEEKLSVIEGSLPEFLKQQVDEVKDTETVKLVLIRDRPKGFEQATEILMKIKPKWIEGTPSSLDLAVADLREEGKLTGVRKWVFKNLT